jgi:maleamate amidohydrolase
MGLRFIQRDERILYISEALETYKGITGTADVTELPCLYKKRKHPAVLVIDEQYAFTSPYSITGTKGLNKEARQLLNGMVENTKNLLDAARKKRIPIFYFYVSRRRDGADLSIMEERNPSLSKICIEGTKMVEIDERIKPQKGDFVMEKKMPSAFFGTPLGTILKSQGVDVNIVVGDSTSGCVRATVVDSVQNSYYTVIPEECVGDRCVGAHKASLFDIMMKYADVASLEDVLSWIRSLG